MNILDQLASTAGERAQQRNLDLAAETAKSNNHKTIEQLVNGLSHQKKPVRHDCIKVLYEIAELKSSLVSPYADAFLQLLRSPDNRMQWGAMTTLSAIASCIPAEIFEALPKILSIADAGSVITKDHAVRILVTLSGMKDYSDSALPLLLEQLRKAPNNQLPAYAEQTLTVIREPYSELFRSILQERFSGITPESKKKRVEKVLKKI